MNANHWSNCDASEHRTDLYGHDYCATCGCWLHTSNTCATGPGSLVPQQSDAGDCANSPGIVTETRGGSDAQ